MCRLRGLAGWLAVSGLTATASVSLPRTPNPYADRIGIRAADGKCGASEDGRLFRRAGGLCLAASGGGPDASFFVGTDDGAIHKAAPHFAEQTLVTLRGHRAPVTSVKLRREDSLQQCHGIPLREERSVPLLRSDSCQSLQRRLFAKLLERPHSAPLERRRGDFASNRGVEGPAPPLSSVRRRLVSPRALRRRTASDPGFSAARILEACVFAFFQEPRGVHLFLRRVSRRPFRVVGLGRTLGRSRLQSVFEADEGRGQKALLHSSAVGQRIRRALPRLLFGQTIERSLLEVSFGNCRFAPSVPIIAVADDEGSVSLVALRGEELPETSSEEQRTALAKAVEAAAQDARLLEA